MAVRYGIDEKRNEQDIYEIGHQLKVLEPYKYFKLLEHAADSQRRIFSHLSSSAHFACGTGS